MGKIKDHLEKKELISNKYKHKSNNLGARDCWWVNLWTDIHSDFEVMLIENKLVACTWHLGFYMYRNHLMP
jgi:hypothetical protein